MTKSSKIHQQPVYSRYGDLEVDTPEVMTIEELGEYLQVAKSTLYKLAQDGKVPGQKVGKHWRFSKSAIDSWLSERGPEQGLPEAEDKVNG